MRAYEKDPARTGVSGKNRRREKREKKKKGTGERGGVRDRIEGELEIFAWEYDRIGNGYMYTLQVATRIPY